MSITRNFKLFLNAGRTGPLVIHANQYDSGEQWVFSLFTDAGIPYTPSTGAIVGIKSDNLGIINSGTVVDGKVVINETEQMTAAPGKAVFELLLDDQTHGTANFYVQVEPKPGNNADLSESDLSLIQQAIDSTSPTVIANTVSDWLDEHITNPTNPAIDTSLSVAGAAADAKATGDAIAAISQSSGLTADVKQALMDFARAVAFKSNVPLGQTYIDALEDALYPPIDLSYITAVYTQSGTVYDTDSLDSLKSDLVVTAHYTDTSTEVVESYILSGTLHTGTSVITVTYGGKTTTFSVTVTENPVPYNLNYAFSDITLTDGYINDSGELATLENNKLYNELVPAVGFCLVTSSGAVYVTGSNKSLRLAEYGSSENFIARTYAQNANKIIGSNNPSYVKMGFSNSDTVLAGAERFVGLNVLDTTLCTIPNMSVDADGNEVAMNGVSLSDYLPINNDGYLVGYVQDNYDTEVVAFFDENKTIISRHTIVPQTSAGEISAFAIPSTAEYVRFRCSTTPHATQYISYVR